MAQLDPSRAFESQSQFPELGVTNEAYASGVSWASVIAGAFVTAALALILLTLGTGLNLSMTPPTVTRDFKVGPGTIVWLITIQIIASAMGGYLAGRLRTKWSAIHTDEVYFRDTAHGFLVWAVALVVTVSFLASSASSILAGSFMRSNAGLWRPLASEVPAEFNLEPNAYFIDSLFRSDRPAPARQLLPANLESPSDLAAPVDRPDLGLQQAPLGQRFRPSAQNWRHRAACAPPAHCDCSGPTHPDTATRLPETRSPESRS